MCGFNLPVMHRHSALSCFVARAMPSVPPALAGNSGPRGVLGGGVSDDLLAENVCVAGFNPPVMHRHSALCCFVARAISSVPPALAGNSGLRGMLRRGGLGLSVDFENLGVGGFNPASDTWP